MHVTNSTYKKKRKLIPSHTMSSQSTSSRCRYCHKPLRTDSAMKRHIAATPKCKRKWEEQILAAATNLKATPKSTSTHLEVDDFVFDDLNTWDNLHNFIPEPSQEAGPSKLAHVEDNADEDPVILRKIADTKNRRFVEEYPRPVGIAIGQGKTKFQVTYEEHMAHGQTIYSPFTNEDEWELAKWLSRRVGQKAIDEYLKLSIVSPDSDYKCFLQQKKIG
jgi:hypothetical protein